MSINRRDFLKMTVAGIAVGAFPGIAIAGSELLKKKGQRVVIVGGGFGGATAAKYIRDWSHNKVEVVLIERNAMFISCPMSNTVLGGSRKINDLTRSYDALKKKHGVKLIHGEVTAIDPEKQTVMLSKGHLSLLLDWKRTALQNGGLSRFSNFPASLYGREPAYLHSLPYQNRNPIPML